MNHTDQLFRFLIIALYGIGSSLIVYFLVTGFDYYTTAYGQRPFHADYRALRPAGRLGLLFGTVGTAMMALLLLYSVRKRTRLFGRLFRLKHWLDVHIFFGVTGPLFILLHTSFKFDGLVAVSFYSMTAVALSGVFGRYLYIQIPRNIKGDSIGVDELEARNRELTTALERDFALEPQQIEDMMIMLYGDPDRKPSLLGMIFGDLVRPWRLRSVRRALPSRFSISEDRAEALVSTALRKSTLQRRIGRLKRVQRLFHYWHVIHRPFALVMYLIAMVHIVVALLFGISWRAVG